MTAQQAIERANGMKAGNAVPDNVKLEWLTELDQIIYRDIICTHMHILPLEGETSRWWSTVNGKWVFAPAPTYTDENSGDELIAESPDDMIYVYWLMAKIDLASQELNKYNNDNDIFENAYGRFRRRYHRTHRPIPYPQVKVGVYRP